MEIRFWGDGQQLAPIGVVDRVLRQIGDAAETGVLFLRALGETDVEFHLYEGRIVGCYSVADSWLLARRLISAGTVELGDLELALSCEDLHLHEALVEFGLVSPVILHQIQLERFRDTFYMACATPWESIDFLKLGSLLLPPSAPGMIPSATLAYVASWRREVGDVLGRLRRSPAGRVRAVVDPRELSGEAAVVLGRMMRPTSLAEVVASSPIERYRTLAVIARMAADGSVWFEGDGPDESGLAMYWDWAPTGASWGGGDEGGRVGSAAMMEEE